MGFGPPQSSEEGPFGALFLSSGVSSGLGVRVPPGAPPCFGLHLTEKRAGQVLIDVNPALGESMRDEEFAALGYYVGGAVGDRIPVIRGVSGATFDQLKFLSAGAGSTGSVALYHMVGVTPEARTIEDACQGRPPEEVLPFDSRILADTKERMSTFHTGPGRCGGTWVRARVHRADPEVPDSAGWATGSHRDRIVGVYEPDSRGHGPADGLY